MAWYPPPGGRVSAEFGVINTGGGPVHVVSVESSCGCAAPRVEPEIILPGHTATVSMSAIPFPVGERTVLLTLHTDSPRSPAVSFGFRMIGTRPPPFILQAAAELQWPQGLSPSEEREITVLTVEPEAKQGRPLLKSSLPFLTLDFVSEAESAYTQDGFVQRAYHFLARPNRPVEAGAHSGEVHVIPPWDEPPHRIPVYAASSRDVRVVPSTLTLHLEGPTDDRSEAALFVAESDRDVGAVVEDARGREGVLLATRKRTEGPAGRFTEYAIRIRSGIRVSQGVQRVVVRAGETGPEGVTVPVLITVGSAQ